MNGNAKTFTRAEIINMVSEIIEGILQDHVKDFIKGHSDSVIMFDEFKGISNWNNDKLANTWCDNCSEKYFDDNPNVDEVLMEVTDSRVGLIQKMWLASKEDVRI